MAKKAGFLARDMKSMKTDICFMQERCNILEEENGRLRDGFIKGVPRGRRSETESTGSPSWRAPPHGYNPLAAGASPSVSAPFEVRFRGHRVVSVAAVAFIRTDVGESQQRCAGSSCGTVTCEFPIKVR
nr:hypothetical protein [Tanacetum cinerariifolium]